MGSATVTSLPTVNQTAVLLPRGVNGNTQLVPVLQEERDLYARQKAKRLIEMEELKLKENLKIIEDKLDKLTTF